MVWLALVLLLVPLRMAVMLQAQVPQVHQSAVALKAVMMLVDQQALPLTLAQVLQLMLSVLLAPTLLAPALQEFLALWLVVSLELVPHQVLVQLVPVPLVLLLVLLLMLMHLLDHWEAQLQARKEVMVQVDRLVVMLDLKAVMELVSPVH